MAAQSLSILKAQALKEDRGSVGVLLGATQAPCGKQRCCSAPRSPSPGGRRGLKVLQDYFPPVPPWKTRSGDEP